MDEDLGDLRGVAVMLEQNLDLYISTHGGTGKQVTDDLAAGRPVKIGSQTGRVSSEPEGGKLTALTTLYGEDGKGAKADA